VRSFIHLLIAALLLASSTSAFALASTENLHLAPTASAQKTASRVLLFSSTGRVGGAALQAVEVHQENGRWNDATASTMESITVGPPLSWRQRLHRWPNRKSNRTPS